ncbi:calpain-like cysteine peptidase, Clan CA, family C2 [Angomonas deanei]|uniref:DUF1935 domain-containing protein n=1 Tax=Angomonas deanei TaxID=59799 RepID=S9WSA9_9TRYP|nr:calpain-like cysteine peptidase, Clan CA, family C2 [Angomonas deanei]EPY39796.1 calpain-like cysteine peptidase, Clan CA, family C2 [Angomonas deanei]CAD2215173.1 Domain of unknown function (DUF1935), putative [Angomonas deanei]|eukprot:EPY38860.1 calpain-like cysteine peptidase, Clan CA, family C2 [Angomonas deanei]
MGCGSSSEGEFKNGSPDFNYSEILQCFQNGNGLCFHLTNKRNGQWAFYNDTKKYEMHVAVNFRQGSDVVALGNTNMEIEDETGENVATVVVFPGETELFIEGDVVGYKARIQALPLSEEYKAHMKEMGK